MEKYRVITAFGGVFGLGGPITSCGFSYVGYKEEGTSIIEETGRVLIDGDEVMFRDLSQRIKKNAVVCVLGIKKENVIEAKEIINVKPDSEESDFLKKQATPVAFIDEQFGLFELDKSVNNFNGKINYQGENIRVALDGEKEYIETFRKLYADFETVLKNAANYAAEELLELANDWGEDDWDEDDGEYVPLTEQDFIERLTLQSIVISEEGTYSLWYDDGDMFWGHAISVDGDLQNGITDASMEG